MSELFTSFLELALSIKLSVGIETNPRPSLASQTVQLFPAPTMLMPGFFPVCRTMPPSQCTSLRLDRVRAHSCHIFHPAYLTILAPTIHEALPVTTLPEKISPYSSPPLHLIQLRRRTRLRPRPLAPHGQPHRVPPPPILAHVPQPRNILLHPPP